MPTTYHVGPDDIAKMYALSDAGRSGLQISKLLNIPKSTVYRHLKKRAPRVDNVAPKPVVEPMPRPAPMSTPKVQDAQPVKSPLDMRLQKLVEVQTDIVAARARNSVHVLPTLHRLEIELHDQIIALQKEQAEAGAGLNADECIATIVSAAVQLPPLLRHRLYDELAKLDNVIAFNA